MSAQQAVRPDNYIFSRKYTCPVCNSEFENWALRMSRLKLDRMDTDLKPYYDPFNTIYYDAVICSHCGYASMQSNFKNVTDAQIELIKNKVVPRFKPVEYPIIYTPDIAIERFNQVLLNAIVKGAKPSEKAYICLKMAWLNRDRRNVQKEKKYIRLAIKGFTLANEKETFPIFGMDEPTTLYLIGELTRRLGEDLDEALKYISYVLVNRNITERLKERATEVKELIRKNKEGIAI